ncbi:MAG: 4Fe-4S binding protein [Spirochaetales bacterium]|nr:4Fe-4S binding protein [Spirochaetales bacterium]
MKSRHQSIGKAIKAVIQVLFLLFVFWLVAAKTLGERGIILPFSPASVPGLHAVCPFGAVETAGRLVIEGEFIPKTFPSNFWVLLGALGMTLVFGPLFCSRLCPLGSVQEWIGKAGRKIFGKRFNRFIPRKIDYALGFLRFIVLGLVLVKTWQSLALVFVNVDPYYALFHFWTGDALPTAILVLAVVLIASLFTERPWCRWLCPFGAVQGIVQLFSPWKIRRNRKACVGCGKCSGACPMRIRIHEKTSVSDTRCNRCGECVGACPVSGGLSLSLPGSRVGIAGRAAGAVIALALFFTPLVSARIAGVFDDGAADHDPVQADRDPVQADRDPVRTEMKAEEIEPAMTIADVAKGFGMTPETLNGILALPPDIPGSTKIRDLEDIRDGLTTRLVRELLGPYGPLSTMNDQ